MWPQAVRIRQLGGPLRQRQLLAGSGLIALGRASAAVGISYRPLLAPWIEARPPQVECLEVLAESFYKGGGGRVRALSEIYPLVVHTCRLSLGTPGPLNPYELAWWASVVAAANPLWVSEHLGFSRNEEVDLGWPIPISLNGESLALLIDHAREVMKRGGKPLLIENISHLLPIRGALSEPEFLSRLCEETGCGLLLDLTALTVNGRNHGFDPRSWLDDLALERVVQLHVGGCAMGGGRWVDSHADPVPDDVLELAAGVLTVAPVRAVILERDGGFPLAAELEAELRRVRSIVLTPPASGETAWRRPVP